MLYSVVCLCEYCGSAYSGWQRQKNAVSVQSLIEEALKEIYGEEIKIAGSGRTDAGVHALGQVFSFASSSRRPPEAILKGANGLLPPDIVIREVMETVPGFHAGKSAVSKTYEYKIVNGPLPRALSASRALWIRAPIDLEKLNAVLEKFEGLHDFASFCVKKTKREDTVRRVNFAKARRQGEEVIISVNASGFLHNMVRIMTGTALMFLRDGTPPEKILEIINAKDRREAAFTAPPHGLYQKEVFYNDKGVPGLLGIPESLRITTRP